MEILVEYIIKQNNSKIRSIRTNKLDLNEIVLVGQISYRIVNVQLNEELWNKSGIISYFCEILPLSILERIAFDIAKNSPVEVSWIDAYNNMSTSSIGECGEISHDENFYYLTLGSFDVKESISQFENELKNNIKISSPFDLKFTYEDNKEYLLSKDKFKLSMSFPWFITPDEMKERDGFAVTVMTAIIEKGKFEMFEKFYSEALDSIIPGIEFTDGLTFGTSQ